MIVYRDVKDFNPAHMREFGFTMGRVSTAFSDAASRTRLEMVADLSNRSLRGHTIGAAAQRASRFGEHLDAGSKEAVSLRSATDGFVANIERIKRELERVEARVVATRNLELTPQGTVLYHRPSAVPADGPASKDEAEVTDEGLARAKAALGQRLEAEIQALVREASAQDTEFALKLRLIAEQRDTADQPVDVSFNGDSEVDIGAARRAAMPADLRGDPERTSGWWRGLTPEARQWYIDNEYRRIGWGNGLPAEVRHEANMHALRQDIATGNNAAEARQLLDKIETSWTTVTDSRTNLSSRIYLLGFDNPPDGGVKDARVIVSIGNPDTAAHTSVYVPGTGTDMSAVPGRELERADALRDGAVALAADKRVASIVWLDYNNPDNVGAAALNKFAADGGQRLDDFVNGLNTAHQGPDSHVTAVGHSYGSTVIGQADVQDDGLAVDDMVLVGSPGLGPESGAGDKAMQPAMDYFLADTVDNTSDLHRPGDRVWALAAPDDFVPKSEAHGADPTEQGFGARHMAADTWGHSGYWERGSESLRNQAAVIAGEPGEVKTIKPRIDTGLFGAPPDSGLLRKAFSLLGR